jgi:hypothetical protein
MRWKFCCVLHNTIAVHALNSFSNVQLHYISSSECVILPTFSNFESVDPPNYFTNQYDIPGVMCCNINDLFTPIWCKKRSLHILVPTISVSPFHQFLLSFQTSFCIFSFLLIYLPSFNSTSVPLPLVWIIRYKFINRPESSSLEAGDISSAVICYNKHFILCICQWVNILLESINFPTLSYNFIQWYNY